MATKMPEFRTKVLITADNSNKALRDIIRPTSIGSYVESVEAINYGFYNTKISIMIDNWINGVAPEGLTERFTRRVIVYNRVNLSSILPEGLVIPSNLQAALILLNSKYRLDLTEDDIEISGGVIKAKPTSLGYYSEQGAVTEKACYSDRFNTFLSNTCHYRTTMINGLGSSFSHSNTLIRYFEIKIENISTGVVDMFEIDVTNGLFPVYVDKNANTYEAIAALQDFFSNRADIEVQANFETLTVSTMRAFGPSGPIGPISTTSFPIVIPNLTFINKTAGALKLTIRCGIMIGPSDPISKTTLMDGIVLEAAGSKLPACPLKHREFITTTEAPSSFDGDPWKLPGNIITHIGVNGGLVDVSSIEVDYLSNPTTIDPTKYMSAREYISDIFRLAGLGNCLRVYHNSNYHQYESNSEDRATGIPKTYMFENITSEVVTLTMVMASGEEYVISLAPDPRKDEPWFRRFTYMYPDNIYHYYNGSYNTSMGAYTYKDGVEDEYLFNVVDYSDMYKYINTSTSPKRIGFEMNLWHDITDLNGDGQMPVVTIENLLDTQYTLECRWGWTDSLELIDSPTRLIPFMTLGPKGVAGDALDYSIADRTNLLTGENIHRPLGDYAYISGKDDYEPGKKMVGIGIGFTHRFIGPFMSANAFIVMFDNESGDISLGLRSNFPQKETLYMGGFIDGEPADESNAFSKREMKPSVYTMPYYTGPQLIPEAT